MGGRPLQDLAGKTFGSLTVTRLVPGPVFTKKHKRIHGSVWECSCICGNTLVTSRRPLVDGRTRSCGCLRDSLLSRLSTTHGATQKKNRSANTLTWLTFKRWMTMKARCYNKSNPSFPRYSSRGITVCDRWLSSFSAFLEDMGEVPSCDHTLDRIDNDKGYSPENCRWATASEQVMNRSNTVFVEINGETRTLMEWCVMFNQDYQEMYNKIVRHHFDPEIAFREF